MRLFSVIVICCGITPAALHAHEDPRGEVYPEVRIANGSFVVQASDNRHSGTGTVKTITRSYSPDGKLLKARTDVVPEKVFRPYHDYSFFPLLPEEHNGREASYKNKTIIVPDYERKHGGAPYLIVMDQGQPSYHLLNWRMPDVDLVWEVLIDGDDAYFLVTRVAADRTVQLWLHRFSLVSFTEEGAQRLSDPCTIYSFPICSNLILQDGIVYLALIAGDTLGFRVELNGWDGRSRARSEQILSRNADWNSHLSLAHIGDDAVVAYHCAWSYGLLYQFFPSSSTIQTVFFKLKRPDVFSP